MPGLLRRLNQSKPEVRLTRDHNRQVLQLAFCKSTKVQSHTCCKCDEVVNRCSKSFPNGKTFPSPFCSILGPTLCANCSIKINRQHAIKDTTRILGQFSEKVTRKNAREQALYSRLRHMVDGESNKEDEYRRTYSSLMTGAIARQNTPCLNIMKSNINRLEMLHREKEPKYMFCQHSLKDTLKRVSSMMGDKGGLTNANLSPSSVNTDNSNVPSKNSEVRFPEISPRGDLQSVSEKMSGRNIYHEYEGSFGSPNRAIINTDKLSKRLPSRERSFSISSVASSIMELEFPPLECYYDSDWDLLESTSEESSYNSSPIINLRIELPKI